MRKSRNKLTVLRSEEVALPRRAGRVVSSSDFVPSKFKMAQTSTSGPAIPGSSISILQGVRFKKPNLPVSESKRSYATCTAGNGDCRLPTTSQRLIAKFPNKYYALGPSRSDIRIDSGDFQTREQISKNPNVYLASATRSSEMLRKPTLLEQKKMQWAKEKEELHGLWSPWGKPQEPIFAEPLTRSFSEAPTYAEKSGLSISQSECHLPPIGSRALTSQYGGLANSQEFYSHENGNGISRKASLPSCIPSSNGDHQGLSFKYNSGPVQQRQTVYHNQREYDNENEHTSGYYSDNNPYDEYNVRYGSGGGRVANLNQRNDNHNYQEHQQNRASYSNAAAPFTKLTGSAYLKNSDQHNRNFGPTSFDNLEQKYRSKRYESHSSGEISANQNRQSYPQRYENTKSESQYQYMPSIQNSSRNPPPAPPAMRSSFIVGTDGLQAQDYNMELQKQEKSEWLHQLEQQREQDRIRKQQDKDDKRPRWGDKGIGVGHFWEPSDPNSHLPVSPATTDVYNTHSPAWLEKSLAQNAKNLNDSIAFGNNVAPNVQVKFVAGNAFDSTGYTELEQVGGERTFLRGHNVPIDPDVFAEKEKKRVAALEHQEAIRKQIEERQMKLRQEREKRFEEEMKEEKRVSAQRLKEFQRLQMEASHLVQKDHDKEYGTENANVSHESEYMTERQSRINSLSGCDRSDNILQEIEDGKYITEYTENAKVATLPRAKPKDIKKHQEDRSLQTGIGLENFSPDSLLKQRSRSLSSNREFGTQTEPDEKEKLALNNRSQNVASTSPNRKDQKKEKPRWGANPIKKQYVKQSEKDPMYQNILRKRLDRVQMRETKEINGSRTRANFASENNHLKRNRNAGPVVAAGISNQADARKPNSRKPGESTVLPTKDNDAKKVFRSRQLRSQHPKFQPEPKIELLSAVALEYDGSILTSSEDESGTLFSSPSLGRTFVGSPGFAAAPKERETVVSETSTSSPDGFGSIHYRRKPKGEQFDTEHGRYLSHHDRDRSRQDANYRSTEFSLQKLKASGDDVEQIITLTPERSRSPPVPAVLRKIRAGIHPVPYPYAYLSQEHSREHSPSPKWAEESQDIIRTSCRQSGSRHNISTRGTERHRSDKSTRTSTTTTTVLEVETELPNMSSTSHSSPRLNMDGTQQKTISPRPSTMESEVASREHLISYVMRSHEVQSQISARESELSERGIIEFSIRVPSQDTQSSSRSYAAKSETMGNSSERVEIDNEEYTDPLLSERERATIRWLYSGEETPKTALLTHLSYLKKGIQLQQQEWGVIPTDTDGA